MMDVDIIQHALACNAQYSEKLQAEAEDLTGLKNTNSVAQIKNWLETEKGVACSSLNKDSVKEIFDGCTDPDVRRLMELRGEMGKTSVSKYEAMDLTICEDDRIKGILQYYGASRTGRWAGRLVQVHNLPQNHLLDLDYAREILKSGDYDLLEMLYGSVSDTLSQLIRTAFIPSPRCRFIVADFSAIEARVIAWLAGEQWRLDVFNGHGKIYEASAAQMFNVPAKSITKDSPLRQKGKVAELALGYAGGSKALEAMGALKMGLPANELPELVEAWRATNPKIVKLWKTVQNAAIKAVKYKTSVSIQNNIEFIYKSSALFIRLPSGRKLAYLNPRIGESRRNDWNKSALLYDDLNQTTRKWETEETYGGKLTENLTQGIARDCLAESMARVAEAGYPIVFHVHDEIVIDMSDGGGSADDVCGIMGQPIAWAQGLPLKAAGFEATYYKKE
jgi:DNA polymerase